MGGLDKPATVILEPEMAWDNTVLRSWLERLCADLRAGLAPHVPCHPARGLLAPS